jgi:VWFA-related protein
MDTSQSMDQTRSTDQAIATNYAEHVLEQKTDLAFVMHFNARSQVLQNWTSSPGALTSAIRRISSSTGSTALFDTLYAACRYQFGKLDRAASGNFILLFSDGEDDASYLPMQTAVDMCQQSNTAIYVFRTEIGLFNSKGPGILTALASQTGGRVFRNSTTTDEIEANLRLIVENLRNQYRLVYNPAHLTHNGAFHQIVILPPDRVASIDVRSGYYAPSH